jgi:hypothetical protein
MIGSIFSRRWIVLGVACALALGVYATAARADVAPTSDSQTLSFDPFTLTTTTTTSSSGSTSTSVAPAIRPPTRNPFRPPARSPFIPGPTAQPALD